MSKKSVVILAILFFACVCILSVAFGVLVGKSSTVMADTSSITEQIKTITASGEGAIKVTPDVAYVTLGVVTEGKDLKTVQSENAVKMNEVMKSLTDLGINKEDIQTSNYYVSPKYNWDDKTGQSNIVGYTVSNTLEVTVNDIAKSGNLLDKVVASGGNRISGIRFDVKDKTALYNQALEIAVKDAKNKAIAMGKGLGITNIEPLRISEVGSRYVPIYADKNMYTMNDSVAESTPISSGELEVTANVNVEFSFK